MKSILIVEDELFIAEDIKQYLIEVPYRITAVANNYNNAIKALQKETPDLALLDINLGRGPQGIDVAHYIRKNHDFPLIYLTSYASAPILERAKATQPNGYLVKPFRKEDLYTSIEIALHNYSSNPAPKAWKIDTINAALENNKLTKKEFLILGDIYNGLNNNEIAASHFVSLSTVKSHLYKIYQKMDVNTRYEAIVKIRAILN